MNHQPKLSGIAAALASHGRNGDTELLHVSKSELADLQAAGAPLGIKLTKNPHTGLYEAFNWLGTVGSIGGGILGGILTAGNPMGVAAGAALGGGLGTAAGGGTTNQIIMSSVISGIGGYVGGGGLSDLATEGEKAIAEEGSKKALEETASKTAQDVAGGSLSQESFKNIPSDVYSNVTEGFKNVGTPMDQQLQTLQNVNAGFAGKTAGDTASYVDKLTAGWKATPGAFAGQGSNLFKTGVAALGVGAINPGGTSNIITPQTSSQSTANPYKAEVYYTPDGQRRTRIVGMARGGDVYGDYDGADEAQPDDGYMTGGTTYMASGGAAAKGDVYAEDLNTPTNAGNRARPTPNVLAKGFFTKEDYANATPEERAEMDRLMNAKQEMVPSPMRKQYPGGFADGGGIGDLGGYSDGGRLLKGPGDGVSDSIPADIDGRKPARLADGEFVVPARAVSELGNGSTEAGSKQLYKMLDRIAEKRKKGRGLAYEANPQKLMPA